MELECLGSRSESLHCWAVFSLFLAVMGLCCCMWTGLLSSVMCRLLIAVTPFVDHRLLVHGLSSCGLWALEHELSGLVHRLSCLKA